MVDWNKEVKLSDLIGREKKTKQPKAKKTKQPKAKEKQPKAKKEKQPKEKQAKGQHVPFYKRELSFGGKKGDKPKARPPKGKAQDASASKRLKRVTGLKIGGSQLAAARVHNNGGPELIQVAREELEPRVGVGGELRPPEALPASPE